MHWILHSSTVVWAKMSQESPEYVGAPLHHITPCRQRVETSLQFNHKQASTSSFFGLPAATPSQVTFPWWPHWLHCSETAPNRWWRHKFLSGCILLSIISTQSEPKLFAKHRRGQTCFCLWLSKRKLGNWTFLSWSRQSANSANSLRMCIYIYTYLNMREFPNSVRTYMDYICSILLHIQALCLSLSHFLTAKQPTFTPTMPIGSVARMIQRAIPWKCRLIASCGLRKYVTNVYRVEWGNRIQV